GADVSPLPPFLPRADEKSTAFASHDPEPLSFGGLPFPNTVVGFSAKKISISAIAMLAGLLVELAEAAIVVVPAVEVVLVVMVVVETGSDPEGDLMWWQCQQPPCLLRSEVAWLVLPHFRQYAEFVPYWNGSHMPLRFEKIKSRLARYSLGLPCRPFFPDRLAVFLRALLCVQNLRKSSSGLGRPMCFYTGWRRHRPSHLKSLPGHLKSRPDPPQSFNFGYFANFPLLALFFPFFPWISKNWPFLLLGRSMHKREEETTVSLLRSGLGRRGGGPSAPFLL
ncbi:hypothetical protein Taro_000672, partial [Colocasia esculenta]|nr:hypothetical protein [Colocasia esculenta]